MVRLCTTGDATILMSFDVMSLRYCCRSFSEKRFQASYIKIHYNRTNTMVDDHWSVYLWICDDLFVVNSVLLDDFTTMIPCPP